MTTEKTMSFEEFKKEVTENILSYLPEEYSESTIDVIPVSKNNTDLTSLNILKPGSNITPSVYLEFFFEDYKKGMSMDFILRQIANIRVKNDIETFDISILREWKYAKDKVYPQLIRTEGNEKLLQDTVHKEWIDMSILYFGLVENTPKGITGCGKFLVKPGVLKEWGISEEELHEAAMENLLRAPVDFRNLSYVMYDEIRKRDKDIDENFLRMSLGLLDTDSVELVNPLYVLRTDVTGDGIFGANVLLISDTLERVASDFGGSFFILPSSINEVLVVHPFANDKMPVDEMKAMVSSINEEEIAPDERLTDSIYFYDADKKELTIVA